jgi:hypothetical protein
LTEKYKRARGARGATRLKMTDTSLLAWFNRRSFGVEKTASVIRGAEWGLCVSILEIFNQLRFNDLPVALYPGVVRDPDGAAYQGKPDVCRARGPFVAPNYAIGFGEDAILDVISDEGCLHREWEMLTASDDTPFSGFLKHVDRGREIATLPIRYNAWLANEPSGGHAANCTVLEFNLHAAAPDPVDGDHVCLGLYASKTADFKVGDELFWCYGESYAREYKTSCGIDAI